MQPNIQQVRCQCGSVLNLPFGDTETTCPNCNSTIKISSPRTQTSVASSASYSRLKLAPTPQRKSLPLIIGIGTACVIVLATTIIAVVLLYSGDADPNVAEKTENKNKSVNNSVESVPATNVPKTTKRELIRVAKLPENDFDDLVTEFLPKDLLDAAPFDVIKYFDALNPETNQMVEYLKVVSLFSDEINLWRKPRGRQPMEIIDRDLLRKVAVVGETFETYSVAPKLIAKTDAAINRVEKLLNGSGARITIPPTWEAFMPYGQGKRNIARVLHARAYSALKNDGQEKFVREMQLLGKLPAYDCRPMDFVSDLVDIAIASIFLGVVDETLSSGALTENTITDLHKILSQLESERMERGVTAYYMEHLRILHFCLKFKSDPVGRAAKLQKFAKSMGEFYEGISITPAITTKVVQMTDAEFDQWVGETNRFFGEVYQTDENRPIRFLDAFGVAKENDALLKQVDYQRQNIHMALFAPPMSSYFTAISRSLTDIRGMRCLCALAIWNKRFDRLPESIEELFENSFGVSPPLDPFDGQPMRMANINGKIVFYAIGPDGKDDEGRIQWNGSSIEGTGDRVFELRE